MSNNEANELIPRLSSLKPRRVTFGVTLLVAVVANLIAARADDAASQLIQFIESPPPIRAMVVECIWPRQAAGRIDTNWVALCWQTNAYILRNSKSKVGLYDQFDTNKDSLITVRAGGTYSSISDYKRFGVHIEQLMGSLDSEAHSKGTELVASKIKLQEELVSGILGVGIPIPNGAIYITNGYFVWRDNSIGRTIAGTIQINEDKAVNGIAMTNTLDRTEKRERTVIPMSVKYIYKPEIGRSWFPAEIIRTCVIRGTNLTICRLIVHDLEFGVESIDEFYPERFLTVLSTNRIVTSNGISYVTLNGVTKPVLNSTDPKAKGIPLRDDDPTAIRHRFILRLLFLALALGPLALLMQYWRKHRK